MEKRTSGRRLARVAGWLLLVVLVATVWRVVREPRFEYWVKLHLWHPMDRAEELTEAQAIRYFDLARIGDSFRYDPVAYLLMRPHQRSVWAWPEHASGELVLETNDLGMREDAPSSAPSSALGDGPRVLVAGDSHTAGLVPNAESFANVAEALLRERPGLARVDVLNAGVAYTGPACYLRVLRRYLELEPDVFVAVLFVGNDFADDLHLRYTLDGWTVPRADPEYYAPLQAALAVFPDGIYQGYNQAYRWKHHPGERERAFEAVVDSFRSMHALCRERGIAFLPVLLPTKLDVDGADDAERRARLRATLGLSEDDVGIGLRLGERVVQTLEAEGVSWLDPTPSMRAAEEPLFWRQDYHLNTAGHALVGRLLAERLAELLVPR